MTGTKTFAAVHSIDHFALNVPSIAEASRFYNAFGLDVRSVNGDKELELRAQDGHRWGRILAASHKSLAYLSFNCFEGDLEQIKKQVQASGATLVSPSAGQNPDGFWCHDPDGGLIHVNVGPKTTPHFKVPGAPPSAVADIRGSRPHAEIVQIRPRRMSHLLLFTVDIPRSLGFYEGGLGLRVADRSGNDICFTHARHGSDHHLVAFARSKARGLHHVAWDVAHINEAGQGGAQMAAAGYKRGWGTGRHVLGSNYFNYVMDPWGSFSEYSADIDFISAGSEWPAGDYPSEDALYQWGPDLPEYFLKNTEIPERA